jgi:hypothetical protein
MGHDSFSLSLYMAKDALLPSPIHLLTASSTAALSQRYTHGHVLSMLLRKDARAAISGLFESEPSSSLPTLIPQWSPHLLFLLLSPSLLFLLLSPEHKVPGSPHQWHPAPQTVPQNKKPRLHEPGTRHSDPSRQLPTWSDQKVPLKRGKDGIFELRLPGDAASGMTEEIAHTMVLRQCYSQLALAEQGEKRWSVSLAERSVGIEGVTQKEFTLVMQLPKAALGMQLRNAAPQRDQSPGSDRGSAAQDDMERDTDAGVSSPPDTPPAIELAGKGRSEGPEGVYDEGVPGDLAYPFYRRQGSKPFRTGEIAQLADPAGDGRAELVVGDNEKGTGIFVVVSDEQVSLKGGRLPKTSGEEELCHWVAKVGEVEVQVRGPVNVGDLIGPLRDGTGTGIVKPAGAQDVIGKAVAKKQDDGTGSVTLSCHFEMARGLNGDGPIHPTILCNIKAGLGPASGHISTQGSWICAPSGHISIRAHIHAGVMLLLFSQAMFGEL